MIFGDKEDPASAVLPVDKWNGHDAGDSGSPDPLPPEVVKADVKDLSDGVS